MKVECFRLTVKQNHLFKCMLALLGYIICYIGKTDALMIAMIIAMNIYCMTKSKNNNVLFIINFFLFFSNYSIYAYYFSENNSWGKSYGYYGLVQFPELLHQGAYVLYIFTVIIFAFYPKVKEDSDKQPLLSGNKKANKEMAYIFMIGIVTISLWSILTKILKGYFPTSTIYEYMTILFILGYYHASDNKKLNRIFTLLLFINIVHVLVSGDRAPAIQFAMIYYVNFWRNRLKRHMLWIGLLIGIIGLNAVGMWRGMYQFDFKILAESMNYLCRQGLTLDTAFAAEAAGLGMVKLAGDSIWPERIYLLMVYITYLFVGARLTGRSSNLSLVAQDAYPYYFRGGGVLPNYGYFYLGLAGVIILGVLVTYYLHIVAKTNRHSRGYHKCLAVWIFITVMNWYLYSPAPLLRGVLIMSVLYCCSTKISLNKVSNFNLILKINESESPEI